MYEMLVKVNKVIIVPVQVSALVRSLAFPRVVVGGGALVLLGLAAAPPPTATCSYLPLHHHQNTKYKMQNSKYKLKLQ